jgi:hypothetical protein
MIFCRSNVVFGLRPETERQMTAASIADRLNETIITPLRDPLVHSTYCYTLRLDIGRDTLTLGYGD